MERYELKMRNLFGNILSDNPLDNNVLQMWSKRDYSLSRFYTTGFETILFNKDNSFVLETVLSSSVLWEKEILITGNEKSIEKLSKTVNNQNLTYHCLDWFSDGLDNFEEKKSTYSSVTHLLVGIDSDNLIEKIPVKKLLKLSLTHKYNLIVYCDSPVLGLNDVFDGAIDYMVGGVSIEPLLSFVVARRSRLVQTEGKSRNFNNDLYSYWQWSLRNREPFIEPMRGF